MSGDGVSDFDFLRDVMPWIQNAAFFVLGIVVTAIIDRRKNLRQDHELWVWMTSTSLSKPGLGASGDVLEYSVKDTKVADPHEVELSVWANGKRDIPAEAFAGQAARIGLGVPIVYKRQHRTAEANEARTRESFDKGQIEIEPSVIRRGMAVDWVFLTEGKPTVTLEQAPLNTEFVWWQDEYRRPRPGKTWTKVVGWLLVALAIVTFVLAISIRPVLNLRPEDTAALAGFATSFLLMGGISTLTLGASALGRRLSTAKKTLERKRFGEPSIVTLGGPASSSERLEQA